MIDLRYVCPRTVNGKTEQDDLPGRGTRRNDVNQDEWRRHGQDETKKIW
jgi:hypothetical protein